MSSSLAALIDVLDAKDMKNKDHYKRAILLSQRIQFKIKKLNDDRTSYNKLVAVNTVKDDVGDNQDNLLSPTETIIAYYDDNHCTGFDSAVELSTFEYTKKSLPPITSPMACSPCSLSPPGFTLTPPPPPPTPSKENRLPTIQHVQKRYNGFLGFLTRTYTLHTIVVSRTLLSPYLYASRDMITGERKAVLKLLVMCSHQHEFQITFPPYSSHPQTNNYTINDASLVLYLMQWIKYQPLLPLLVHAKQIFRDGHKLYVVYNHQLLLQ
ncbi:hypothetical protein [Parasitella parasitica]|uniref:Uncharacterized protein n=1 Tax=Parasitella parasitica TaxID=35722 RepID=A0A0B7NTA8_9FUNG|nr:hypothetical protein [Parasitella parasitica]